MPNTKSLIIDWDCHNACMGSTTTLVNYLVSLFVCGYKFISAREKEKNVLQYIKKGKKERSIASIS